MQQSQRWIRRKLFHVYRNYSLRLSYRPGIHVRTWFKRPVQTELIYASEVVSLCGTRTEERAAQRAARTRIAAHHHDGQILCDYSRTAAVLHLLDTQQRVIGKNTK